MGSEAADVESGTGGSPETGDRILVGVCGAIWLVLLAATVIATVALVRLGSGQAGEAGGQSSWLLYSIIAVSAIVIVGAIPLLVRARRTAQTEHQSEMPAVAAPVRAADAPTEKLRVFGVDPSARRETDAADDVARISAALLDRVWLRGTTSLLAAMGLALTAVAVATYLLAVSSDTAAWAALGVAGVITVAMPAILVTFQRQLGEAAEQA
ncbi:MAG: DUF2561 family protein [Actinomycetota bacterium]|nr:DUF2561 family protein [Actinomycetota bacterium]MDA2949270.1 DUF2561 family protein [Actinomycetota bacterium]